MIVTAPDLHTDTWKSLHEIVFKILELISLKARVREDKHPWEDGIEVRDSEEERWKEFYLGQSDSGIERGRNLEQGVILLKEIIQNIESKYGMGDVGSNANIGTYKNKAAE